MHEQEFIHAPFGWPHPHLRPRSQPEAERLMPLPPKAVIFVFGSNQRGAHGGGAARVAVEHFGAVEGIPFGMRGQSFAIPTLDIDYRQLPMESLVSSVTLFVRFAAGRPQFTFYVTAIGTGIAGFHAEQIAPLFVGAPSNCLLPPTWADWLVTPALNRKDA